MAPFILKRILLETALKKLYGTIIFNIGTKTLGWFPGTNTPPITFLSVDFPSLMIHSIYAHTHTRTQSQEKASFRKSLGKRRKTLPTHTQRRENARNSTAITKGIKGWRIRAAVARVPFSGDAMGNE